MDRQTYYYSVSAIFAVIALMHLLRIYNGWDAQIGDLMIPLWISWAALFIAGYLAVRGWQFAKMPAQHHKR